MKKLFLMIGSVFLLSSTAGADVDFNRFDAPEAVRTAVSEEIKKQCPRIYSREYIPVTDVQVYREHGVTEYVVSSNERGYVVNDPFWDFEVTVKYSNYANVISVEFVSRGDCW